VGRGTQAEIEEEKRFYSTHEQVFVALQRTADRLQHKVADLLKPHGLSATQYNALRILRGAGEAGLPCSEIGERMINHDPDITRLMDRLERRGLVRRSRSRDDRRVITSRISMSGLSLLRSLDGPIQQFHRKLLGHLNEEQLQSLIGLLDQAREAP
jgi:MarR family transcriptional regulator, organic hydroperoxide resistance regulator